MELAISGNVKDFISKWKDGERKIKENEIVLSDYDVLLYWWIPHQIDTLLFPWRT